MVREPLHQWADMKDDSANHPQFDFRGPIRLLAIPATAFLCSTRCPS